MSLAQCPNCGKNCSSLAIVCPHCNRPLGFNNSERGKSKIKAKTAVNNSVSNNSDGGINPKVISIIVGVIGVLLIIIWYGGQPKMSNLRYEDSDVRWIETGDPTVGDGWCFGGIFLIILALILPMLLDKNRQR